MSKDLGGQTGELSLFVGTWFTNRGRLELTGAPREVQGDSDSPPRVLRGSTDFGDGRVLRATLWEPGASVPEADCELTLDSSGNRFWGDVQGRGGATTEAKWSGLRLALPAERAGLNPGAHNSLPSGPLLSGPMLGEVSGDSANVWVQARDTSPLTLTVVGPAGALTLTEQPSWEQWLCVVFRLQGLGAGQRYEYSLNSRHGETARGSFRAAPAAAGRTVRLAFGSCYADYASAELPIFDAIAREAPQAMILLGDNCYFAQEDWQTEHTMMLAHLRNRSNPVFLRLAGTTSLLAIYDDHDFGPNDADGKFAGRDRALAAGQRVWAQKRYGLPSVPGIFSAVRIGPVELFLTDGRYHRAVEGNTVLGRAQLIWLLDGLRNSDAPIKIVASGSVVLAHNPVHHDWESWRRTAAGELEELLFTIEKEGITGVVFISGDLHMGQVHHLPGRAVDGGRGPDFWEVTASPLAIEPYNEKILLPPSSLVAQVHDRYNYGMLEVDLDRSGAEVVLFLKDSQGQVLFRQPVDLASLRPSPGR